MYEGGQPELLMYAFLARMRGMLGTFCNIISDRGKPAYTITN